MTREGMRMPDLLLLFHVHMPAVGAFLSTLPLPKPSKVPAPLPAPWFSLSLTMIRSNH